MVMPPKYLIYPSLLDKYQSLLDYEQEADAPWNKWTEKKVDEAKKDANIFNPIPEVGDYILTPDEMYDKIEGELIDTINRVERTPSEAAERGTALNEVIDCLINNAPSERKDMKIQSLRDRTTNIPYAIRSELHGFVFNFDLAMCRRIAAELKGSVCQFLLEAQIATKYGDVMLYGYADYSLNNHIIDLKTTSMYDFGKYERKWQRYVYPYCAIESGMMTDVDSFIYLAVKLSRSKENIISGEMYPEEYTYQHDRDSMRLRSQVESFIGWLESNREKITDKKIFNQHI